MQGVEAILLRQTEIHMRREKMPENEVSYFLYCEACDFKQDVAKVLPRTPLSSVDELRKEVHRFHCSVCGAKKVTVREPKTPASDQSTH
jgi:Zn finger protein HypA/HybF involved in hydrogenase expression